MAQNVEEQAFGPDECAPPPTLAEQVSAYMFPTTMTVLLVCIVTYFLSKGIEYHDVFQNKRYRFYLFGVNASVVAGSGAIITHAVHLEATKHKEPLA